MKGITGNQAETTVQTWIGITHALFTLDTSETDLTDTSKEIRGSYLTGATVEAWTGVAWIGGGQVNLAAHTAEANGTRATEGSLAKVASTAVLTRQERNACFERSPLESPVFVSYHGFGWH